MNYEERIKVLMSEYEQVALSISQPVQRMKFLEGQIQILGELRQEEMALSNIHAPAENTIPPTA